MATHKKRKLVLKPEAAPVDDWQAKDDARTLMQAHQIKSDPKRHAAAKAHAKQQLANLAMVANAPNVSADTTAQAQVADPSDYAN